MKNLTNCLDLRDWQKDLLLELYQKRIVVIKSRRSGMGASIYSQIKILEKKNYRISSIRKILEKN